MTVAPSIKTRCAKCKLVRRNGGRLARICVNARHKGRQG